MGRDNRNLHLPTGTEFLISHVCSAYACGSLSVYPHCMKSVKAYCGRAKGQGKDSEVWVGSAAPRLMRVRLICDSELTVADIDCIPQRDFQHGWARPRSVTQYGPVENDDRFVCVRSPDRFVGALAHSDRAQGVPCCKSIPPDAFLRTGQRASSASANVSQRSLFRQHPGVG